MCFRKVHTVGAATIVSETWQPIKVTAVIGAAMVTEVAW
jgi:hypothetical protein